MKHAWILLAALVAGAAGCGTSPPTRFFTLASEPSTQRASAPRVPEFQVVVGPVTVPDLVDRPHFVLRTAPNRVQIAEQARWAAPLKSEIPRVVADHLARELDGARIATFGQRATGAPDYRVIIDIQRFESAPLEGVTIHALWSIRARDGEPLNGSSLVAEPAGGGYEELVAAHSRALEQVSRDIAAAIKALRGAPTPAR